jgi:hypothetical protein
MAEKTESNQLPIWIGVILLGVIAIGVFMQNDSGAIAQSQMRNTLGSTPVWTQSYPQEEYKPEPLIQTNEQRLNKIRELQGLPSL